MGRGGDTAEGVVAVVGGGFGGELAAEGSSRGGGDGESDGEKERRKGRIYWWKGAFSRRQGWPARFSPFAGAPRLNPASWVRPGTPDKKWPKSGEKRGLGGALGGDYGKNGPPASKRGSWGALGGTAGVALTTQL